MPFLFRYQVARRRPPADAASGCALPRSSGAVAGAEVVTARYTLADAEAGRIESIRRAVLALNDSRSAGNTATRRDTSDANAPPFDPRDPASMTEARWRQMSPEAQRAWIDANVRNDEARRRMISDIANGVFGAVREFITSKRDERLTEIRETNQTERQRLVSQEETRRHLATQETERLRLQGQQAANEAAAAQRAAEEAQNEAQRLRAQAEADAARERQARADTELAAARAREQEASAAAARERLATIQASGGFFSTMPGKIVAGVAGVAVVGVIAAVAMRVLTPPPPPPPAPMLPPPGPR